MASAENKVPVRVLRGYKLRGKWAPMSGYRYDGLYEVCKGWVATGASGFKVYKFAFKRIDGQPPINLKEEPQKGKAESEVEVDSEHTLEGLAEEGNIAVTLSEEQADEDLTETPVNSRTKKRNRENKAVDDIIVLKTVNSEDNTRNPRDIRNTRKRKVDETTVIENQVVLKTKSQRTSKRQRNTRA
jgi:hypothetical protein